MAQETVLSYLENVARKLKVTKEEKEKIETSIAAIRGKLISTFFDDGLKDVRAFGSFDRGTLLSRKVDGATDVDILVMFDEKKFVAQTYLNKLKKFAETHYGRSESYQDHPTVVIELEHITFELVPCIYKPKDWWDGEKFTIPKRSGDKVEWITTEPDYYKKKIHDDHPNTKETLIKLILLFKYWNLLNNSPYSTYEVERFVIRIFDYEENLQYNIMKGIDALNYTCSIDEQTKVNREAKEHRRKIKLLLENSMEEYAIMEMNILLPEVAD